jgi:hypothetical protein
MSILDELGPEWTAAVALAIQAVIFSAQAGILYWQGRTLKRHAVTLEEHRTIAAAQADALKLIAEATEMQSKVLAEQTKVMDEQFKFQRKLNLREENGNLFNLALESMAKLEGLIQTLSGLQQANITQDDQMSIERGFICLSQETLSFQKALLMAIHLPDKEIKYFSDYCMEIFKFGRSNKRPEDFRNAVAIRDKYPDFSARMRQFRVVPEN